VLTKKKNHNDPKLVPTIESRTDPTDFRDSTVSEPNACAAASGPDWRIFRAMFNVCKKKMRFIMVHKSRNVQRFKERKERNAVHNGP